MAKDLTNSNVDRQNILNNPYALEAIKDQIKLPVFIFEGKAIFFKEQVADFFEVSIRTIENYLTKYNEELTANGYEVLRGKRLQNLKMHIKNNNDTEIDFGNIKVPMLGIFDFKSFLNLAMLMVESERARVLRQLILDIVIDTINARTGGGTKYINQRDEDFLYSWFQEENYRQKFTDALRDYVDMGNFKYATYTDKIYTSIFREKAKEYRTILKLKEKDKVRETLYSEVLDLVSSYEYGFADVLKQESEKKGRKLSYHEVDELYREFESQALWKPLIEKARTLMASRDLAFRDALHQKLAGYISPLPAEEFERFLGEKSMELADRLEEAKDVLKRLKERE
ncbi:MAG: DNA-binding protein [Candidatus Cloacimonadaceae bacterium]|jgi:hypothetical protein